MATVKTVDITPTREGFAAVAARLISAILADVKMARKEDDAVLMAEVVDIAFYLGQNSVSGNLPHSEALELRAAIKRGIPGQGFGLKS